MMTSPCDTRAQQPQLPVIGFLSSSSAPGPGLVVAFAEGLKESGFVDGRNVMIEYRAAEGDYDRLPVLARELVAHKVGVIVAISLPAVLAAKAATSTIPIVFSTSGDPVAFGLAKSLNRPEGNLTGLTLAFDPFGEKRLQLLHELVPNAISIGLLINPANPVTASHKDRIETAAQALGVKLSVLTANREDGLEAAFATAHQTGVGALLIGEDAFFVSRGPLLATFAARYAMPAMHHTRDFATAGGLVTYGASGGQMRRQVGIYAGRILKGAKPGDLPIQQPTKLELVINLKAAKVLGLTVPPALLARADEVIE
jgi:putative ABC transport system substrate-binding protein